MASNVNNQDYVCEMCGNEGYKECLIPCSSCDAHQHMYCMMEVMLEVPREWECDECENMNQGIMVPPKKRRMISTCELSSQCASLKKKCTELSQDTVIPPLVTLSHDVIPPLDTPPHDALPPLDTPSHDTRAPLDTVSQDHATPPQDTEPTTKLASSARRKRGRNKNFELTKLTSGEKLPLIFNSIDKKPMCQNRKLWSRHLGLLVRDNSIVKHRTLKWNLLSTTDMDHLWQMATNHFDAEDMETYRDATLAHMKHLWHSWRSELNLNHIKPHNGDLVKIKANKPREFTQEDWEWLLTHHFLTDHFKKVSNTNACNRKNLQYVHHTGSKPFSQVEREMVTKDGDPPTFIDVFFETHTRKDKSCINPAVQQKVDEMRIVRYKNPTISDIDLTETVFGAQKHGTVIGMGSIAPSKLRGRSTLREKNISLQEQIKKLTAYQEAIEAERLQEKQEYNRKLAIISARLESANLPNASMPSTTTSTSPSNIGGMMKKSKRLSSLTS